MKMLGAEAEVQSEGKGKHGHRFMVGQEEVLPAVARSKGPRLYVASLQR